MYRSISSVLHFLRIVYEYRNLDSQIEVFRTARKGQMGKASRWELGQVMLRLHNVWLRVAAIVREHYEASAGT